MHRNFLLLLFCIVLAGCTAEPQQNVIVPDQNSDAAAGENAEVQGISEDDSSYRADSQGNQSSQDKLSTPELLYVAQPDQGKPSSAEAPDAAQLNLEMPAVSEAAEAWFPDEEGVKPLNLSLIYTPDIDSSLADEPVRSQPKLFYAQELFQSKQKRKDSQFSISVVPTFKDSEEATELTKLPELDGGSVSIEVKTK